MSATNPPAVRALHLSSGVTLEVAEQGPANGPAFLLLHGITDTWRSFERVMPLLPAHWRVVALSQRGHGGSSKDADRHDTRAFAQDAAEVLSSLGLAPAVVVGHSMGTSVALRLAIDHPDLVRGLVLGGAFARYSDKAELVEYIASAIEPLGDPIPRAFAEEFQRSTLVQPVDEAFVQAMIEQCLRAPAAVWRSAFKGLLADDFSAELARVAAPVLLVHATQDAYVPLADLKALLAALPQATHELWADAGHAMHWEEPARFAASVVRFALGLGDNVIPLKGAHHVHA